MVPSFEAALSQADWDALHEQRRAEAEAARQVGQEHGSEGRRTPSGSGGRCGARRRRQVGCELTNGSCGQHVAFAMRPCACTQAAEEAEAARQESEAKAAEEEARRLEEEARRAELARVRSCDCACRASHRTRVVRLM